MRMPRAVVQCFFLEIFMDMLSQQSVHRLGADMKLEDAIPEV